jgi:hypothetical protein
MRSKLTKRRRRRVAKKYRPFLAELAICVLGGGRA